MPSTPHLGFFVVLFLLPFVSAAAGVSWGTDTQINTVATQGGAATYTDGTYIYALHQQKTSNNIGFTYQKLDSATDGTSWAADATLIDKNGGVVGMGGRRPSVAYDGNQFYVAHCGQGSSGKGCDIWLTIGTDPKTSLTVQPDQDLGIRGYDYPQIVWCASKSRLLIVHGSDADNYLWYTLSADSGQTWSTDAHATFDEAPFYTMGAPGTYWDDVFQKLYVFHFGKDNTQPVYMTTWTADGGVGTWTADVPILAGDTQIVSSAYPVPLLVTDAAYYVVTRNRNGADLQYTYNSDPTQNTAWVAPTDVGNTNSQGTCGEPVFYKSGTTSYWFCVHQAQSPDNNFWINWLQQS